VNWGKFQYQPKSCPKHGEMHPLVRIMGYRCPTCGKETSLKDSHDAVGRKAVPRLGARKK